MKRGILWAGLLLVLAVPASMRAVNLPIGTHAGTVTRVSGDVLTLKIEVPKIQGGGGKNNQNYINQLRRQIQNQLRNRGRSSGRNNNSAILRARQQLARARNPQEAARARQSLQRAMAQAQQRMRQQMIQQQRKVAQQIQKILQQRAKGGSGVKISTESKEFTVTLDEKVIVRNANLPYAFDDMGNPKEYTKEEVKELRGNNPRLPGYKAERSDVLAGAVVQVTVGRTGKGSMVVILQEGSGSGEKGRKKKK